MKRYNILRNLWLLSLLIAGVSCSDLLDEKPDMSLVTPTTLDELWALLDNNLQVMNVEPSTVDIVSDDVYLLDSKIPSLTEDQYRLYTWSKEPINSDLNSDWSRPYEQILFANIVLSELENFDGKEQNSAGWKELKGAALFYRAYAYFGLARSFCPAYDKSTAAGELGLVLRTSPEIDIQLPRASLEETFHRILEDLKESRELMPEVASVNTRPSKAAVYAMLSRVYLYQGNFEESLTNADLALAVQSGLLDYRTVNATPSRPFVGQLDEVIFYSELILRTYYFFSSGSAVSPDLYGLYEEGDLRKELFFFPRGGFMAYRGQYSYLINPFGGLAVDELLLNKAEAAARLGKNALALESLNILLEKRFTAESFEPVSGLSGEELINKILQERRKELVLRGMRWGDVKRLNVLGDGISLKRMINGEEILLPAGDKRFALPIPQEEISRSGILQNSY